MEKKHKQHEQNRCHGTFTMTGYSAGDYASF